MLSLLALPLSFRNVEDLLDERGINESEVPARYICIAGLGVTTDECPLTAQLPDDGQCHPTRR